MRPLDDIAKNGRIRLIERAEDGLAFQTGGLRVVVSIGGEWDHVSVSLENRCPLWSEMEFVREICFRDDEIAVQYSVPRAKHINNHPYCLHLWRPQLGHGFDLPPKEYV